MNPTSFLARARRRLASSLIGRRLGFPDGHFYSPVASPEELMRDASRIWPAQPTAPGIDFNDASHIDVLSRVFPKFIDDFNYPESTDSAIHPFTFTTKNGQFEGLDPRLLFVVMRSLAPRRVIEVGSGYSSLLMADVNCRFLGERTEITCIDPYPRDFLKRGVPGIRRLIEQRVQDVEMELFASLGPQDILFIDSSHVCKTGSDVNFLLLDVLPKLKPGVFVHIHDIFLPFDYHREWVIDEARGWNEQYLLRALLTFSSGFRVRFGVNYAYHNHRELVEEAVPALRGGALSGGSFWIERQSPRSEPAPSVRPNPSDKPELVLSTAETLAAYRRIRAVKADEYQRRWEFELALAAQEKPIRLHGFCSVCDRESLFSTDLVGSVDVVGEIRIPNWRERVLCEHCGLNNRTRASLHVLETLLNASPSTRIYATEQVTPLFRELQRRYARVIGSEYLGERVPRGECDASGTRNESLTSLSFEDNSQDCILSFDVLEHIPNYGTAITELHRVLVPGGQLMLSVPFLMDEQTTRVRATVDRSGTISYLLLPQYHGDPVSEAGCLCFQDFGWDLLDRLRMTGFSSAEVVLYWSDHYGYYGVEQCFIVAQK